MNKNGLSYKILWLAVFGIAMAFVESAVVVYLRAIFYPEGFKVPLKTITDSKIIIEVFREIATLVMLSTVAHIAGRNFRERFTYLLLVFGIWDIFYYVWLRVLIAWPASIFDWDILFLIPLPWIGPVIAPVSISILMIIFSIFIAHSTQKGRDFKPALISGILALSGIVLILYSFMHDINATLYQQIPKPYRYELLVIGEILFVTAFSIAYVKRRGNA